MKLTSSQAAKLLRQLNEEYTTLIAEERESSLFVAAIQENPDDVRPAYDFQEMQARLDALDAKIRSIKHAINVFNTTHTVPGFDMTIDAVLVYMPQLSRKKEKLMKMSRRLEKSRVDSYNATNIEYQYANYSVREAREMLAQVSETLARLQIALDIANAQEAIDIDV